MQRGKAMDEASPRWLDRKALAHYLSIGPNRVRYLQQAGKLPQTNYHLGPRSPRWDRHEVDKKMLEGSDTAKKKQDMDAIVAKICEENRNYRHRRKK
ncbi:hypothetical protein AA16373_1342 [Komagataeibacter swingsii DSM 16373]|nr:hypothetical protein AA16373_1342 [Komagataeibacter swingsii DSM 16373]